MLAWANVRATLASLHWWAVFTRADVITALAWLRWWAVLSWADVISAEAGLCWWTILIRLGRRGRHVALAHQPSVPVLP